jgi:hypothetical protein
LRVLTRTSCGTGAVLHRNKRFLAK